MPDVNLTVRTPVGAGLVAGSSVAVASHTSTAVGDYLLVIAGSVYQNSVSALQIQATTGVSTWQQVATVNDGTTTISRAWLGKVTTAGARTVTVQHFSDAGDPSELSVHVYTLHPAEAVTVVVDGTPTTHVDRSTPYQHAALTLAGTLDLLICSHASVQFSGTSNYGTAPAGMTIGAENYSGNGFVGMQSCYQTLAASGSTGTRSQTNSITSLSGAAGLMLALRAEQTAVAPTVNAGADASHVVGTAFARTATENDGGAAITARAWTIQAGPTGVGTTIGTAAALSWTPSVTGAYTLRYAATNVVGTGTDDVAVTVIGVPVEVDLDAPGEAVVEGLAVDVDFVVGVRPPPGEVAVEGLSLTAAHILPPAEQGAVEVEGLPVEVSRQVQLDAVDVVVEGTAADVTGTRINPADVRVEGLPVQVSYSSRGLGGRGGIIAVQVPAPTTRFIVQSIRTGSFLTWELPLSRPEITYTLSGPTSITGELTPEDPEVRDLIAAGFEPWACWIHVETDGLIRASGVLLPYQIDGETFSIEAAGPSAYPHGMPYLGDYAGIAVDPADVVRTIWAHLQSYPDGNLGVTVNGTTPVRIGEPEPEEGVEYEDGERPEGPYKLSWWEGPDCGSEIDNLARETPFDYVERCEWLPDKTGVKHWIEIGYPRIGTRRPELRFATGENVLNVVPVEEADDLYASQVIVFGKGEGRDTVRGYAGRPMNTRIRRVAVIQDSTIPNTQRADAVAGDDLERRQGLVDVTDVEVDARHINAKFGTYQVGDDVPLDVEVAWLGRLVQFERILSITYAPDEESVRLQLRRAEAFRYGGQTT